MSSHCTKRTPCPRLPGGSEHRVCHQITRGHSIRVFFFPLCSSLSNMLFTRLLFLTTPFHMPTCGTCLYQGLSLTPPPSATSRGGDISLCPSLIFFAADALAETRPLKCKSPAQFVPLLGAQCMHGFIYPGPLLNTSYMLSTMPGTVIYKRMSLPATLLSKKVKISFILICAYRSR